MPHRGHRLVSDPGTRPEAAVAVCLERLRDGRVRLVIDDLRLQASVPNRVWQHTAFITASEFSRGMPRLTPEEFEGLGRTLWGCLSAHVR